MSVPFTAAAAQPPPSGKLPAVLQALRALAEQTLEPAAFYSGWLGTLCDGSGALAGRCWLAGAPGHWQPIAAAGQSAGIPDAPTERLEELRRSPLPILAHAVGGDDPYEQRPDLSIPTGSVSEVWVPWLVAGELRGAVVVVFAVAHPQAQQGCVKFAVEACESVERFHLLHERRTALRQVELKERELRLDAALHRALDLKTTTAVIANDGRLFLGADRLAVLVARGRKFRVAAVSGQTELAERAGAVRALSAIAAACAPFGRTISYPAEADAGDIPAAALSNYVDRHFVKRFTFVPLFDKPPTDDARTDSGPAPRRLGALIIESFGALQPADEERAKIDALARSAAGALRSARQYESLWLLPLWRVLGNLWQACFGPGKVLRTVAIAAVVALAVAGLCFIEIEFTAYCRGRLEPVEQRRIFAPVDGVVRKVLVEHGAHVKQNDILVELQNTDLDIAAADLQGRRTAAYEQWLAAERTLINPNEEVAPAERTRLSGERERLAAEIASLDRQLPLLAAKRAELVIRSPIEGEITTWNADDLLAGRPVRQGQQLLSIAKVDGAWQLELNVPDDRSGRVVEAARAAGDHKLRVTYSPAVDPGLVREAEVTEIQNTADVHGADGNIVLVRAAIRAEDLPQRRPGAEAAAHVHCGKRSTAYVWSRDLVDFVRSRILFRWF